MTTTINDQVSLHETQTLNEIVAHYPQTLPVLQRFGLDTCCGGALPLCTAAAHHELDLQQVLGALRTAVTQETQR